MGIAGGIDNPGSILVFWRHFPTVLTRQGMILVALEWGGWRGRPGLGSFITSGPAGFRALAINGVGYIDRCCFLGLAGDFFGFIGNFIHEVMEGSLLLGFITLCSFLSSVCGSGSGEGGIGEVVEFHPSSVLRV